LEEWQKQRFILNLGFFKSNATGLEVGYQLEGFQKKFRLSRLPRTDNFSSPPTLLYSLALESNSKKRVFVGPKLPLQQIVIP